MTTQNEVMDGIFAHLGSPIDDIRQQGAAELDSYCRSYAQEHPGQDPLKGWWKDTFQRTWELSMKNHSYERLGALLALDTLAMIPEETPDRIQYKCSRLLEYVRPLLSIADTSVMIAAAHVIGTIVEVGAVPFGESFFDKEIPQAIDHMDDSRYEIYRFGAILMLHQFALKAPGMIYPRINDILNKIWVPLRDSRTMVRERTSLLMTACLEILGERESEPTETYKRIFDEATAGLGKSASVESALGSLLAFNCMLFKQQIVMAEFYRPLCELALKLRDSKEVVIRKQVITLIPSMATYDSEQFELHYLHRCMAFLLQSLGKPTDRDIAYIAIGHLAKHLQAKMKPFINDFVKIAKEHLKMRGKKNAPFEGPIFQALAMLTVAVGPMLTKQMHEVLDLMFPWGLSDALYQALEQIANHIPPLLRTIQDRLLDLLAHTLTGQPFRPLGAPAPRDMPSDVARDLSLLQASSGRQSAETLALALRILGKFDFTGHTLNEFVRDAALPYLEHDSAEVRREAVLASTQLFINDPICHQTSSHSIEIVSDVLEKLLTVAITDPNPVIRRTVLERLDAKFDRHLAQAEDIRCLFIALNDEVFHNRELAIGIIGRMTENNPAYVMPSLRKSLINLITELEYSTAAKQKEESAKLLCLLIGASSSLVQGYAPTILSVLLRTAQSPTTSVTVAAYCVKCIGELARVAGEELIPSVKQILDLVIDMLNDQSSPTKRDAALTTLGQVVSNTGEVIEPYNEHPQLLGVLFRLLRTESETKTRLETIRTMGMLGALDPFKHKLLQGGVDDPNAETSGPRVTDITLLMNMPTTSNDEYYQTVVINSLVNVLQDSTLTTHHHQAVEAIMHIFRTQRLRCVSFLPQVLPAFLGVIRLATNTQDFFLKRLADLILIVRQHIRNYLSDVFTLITDYWDDNSHQQITIISLVEAIARAVEGEFKAYLPKLLQQILRSFDGDLAARHLGDKRLNTLLHILKAFYVFGSSIEDYLHLVLPVIVRSFENPLAPDELRKAALRTTGQLCRKVNFSDHASQIIHPLVRTLGNSEGELRNVAMDTLCVLVLQFGPDYAIFIPMVNKSLVENNIKHGPYEQLVTKLLNRERLPPDLGPVERYANDIGDEASVSNEQAKYNVNQQALKAAWDCSRVVTPADWLTWIKSLGLVFMGESPSQALRASTAFASLYAPFGKELFNVAFVSCWNELYDSYQEDLVHNLEVALTHTNVPPDVVNVILNLAEFMEHDDKALSIEPRILGDYASAFHAYAKALHYKETEFFSDISAVVVEDLISVNQKLQQTDAAWGTLEFAQNNLGMTHDVLWYEKLGRWEEALQVWHERAADPETIYDETQLALGKLQCLHALGEWEELSDFVQVRWPNARDEERRQIAPLAAAASWSLYQWDLMDDYIGAMKSDTADRSFFKAIIAVHRNQFSTAARQITKARERLDSELTSLTGESYGRAYDVVVRVQMLAELEEIITYKEHSNLPDRQLTQRKTWQKRLEGTQHDVEVWQRILQVRSLVLTPNEDMETWINFAELCRTSDRLNLAEKTLTSLVGNSYQDLDAESRARAPPAVIFAYFCLNWAKAVKLDHRDDKLETLGHLRTFAVQLSHDIGLGDRDSQGRIILPDTKLFGEYTKLLAKCHVELGQWQAALRDGNYSTDPSAILHDYSLATELDPEWYQAWHTWALANFDVITTLEVSQQGLSSSDFTTYIIPAVEGFLRSIALSPGNSLQDTLRLLTLWFTYGYQLGVSTAISQGLRSVNVDVWLEVIPQIIARIHTRRPAILSLIVALLQDIGKAHPQALIYPLTVASKSPVESRKRVAESITAKMREHAATIVTQADLVSTELIRAAILWHEQWHEGLEEASKYYFAEANITGMFEVLDPLHEMVEKGPQTLRETSFVQSFGHELRLARDHCRRFKLHGDQLELNQAWDIYYATFQRLAKQLKLLNVIELQYVSPRLMGVRDLELAVPGTYQSNKPVIAISYVLPTFNVIASKQRPRRFSMRGRDGKEYTYLLKGHEDLRQDERVMQLFGLVNTLLNADQESAKRHLSIQQYSVTPLSPGAGLLGWVPHSDTLHTLIKGYRESRKILVDIEHRLMNQMADDNYDSLPLMHKVEVFQYALDNTTGQDLYRILWLRSRNSEAWLERRTTYTRSLGVNSMVGYILGLGDRHPSNLLLDQITGKVVHIDFGDCFEVAMQRDKYPERVPFRLTRMLIHAMEVCGITGTFSRSCEVSMEVLRENKESLMAVLEAFVYDPLIAWRLIPTNNPGGVQQVRDGVEDKGFVARKHKADETEILNDAEGPEMRNDKALEIIERVRRKLTGRDFKPQQPLDVKEQVEMLVHEATSVENLCVAFVGWCSFW